MDLLLAARTVGIDDIKRVLEIVKDFIRDNGLIVYGGQMIDYALRLKGQQLYDDNALPDLDFYSMNSVNDAYRLAAIIMASCPTEGCEVDVITAIHVQTTKVRYRFFIVADISYLPANIFAHFKKYALTYSDMLIKSPFQQREDIHSSLSMPYRGAPLEQVVSRWTKDIERSNTLITLYPIEESQEWADKADSPAMHSIALKDIDDIYCLHGFAAYALLCRQYKRYCHDFNVEPIGCFIDTWNDKDNSFMMSDDDPMIYIVKNVDEAMKHFNIPKWDEVYRPYLDLVPYRYVGVSLHTNAIGGDSFIDGPDEPKAYDELQLLAGERDTIDVDTRPTAEDDAYDDDTVDTDAINLPDPLTLNEIVPRDASDRTAADENIEATIGPVAYDLIASALTNERTNGGADGGKTNKTARPRTNERTNGGRVEVWDMFMYRIGVNYIKVDGRKYRIANCQFVLQWMLLDNRLLEFYKSLMSMIRHVGKLIDDPEELADTIFAPSVEVYGEFDINESYDLAYNPEKRQQLPSSKYFKNKVEIATPFVYGSEFYMHNGLIIT